MAMGRWGCGAHLEAAARVDVGFLDPDGDGEGAGAHSPGCRAPTTSSCAVGGLPRQPGDGWVHGVAGQRLSAVVRPTDEARLPTERPQSARSAARVGAHYPAAARWPTPRAETTKRVVLARWSSPRVLPMPTGCALKRRPPRRPPRPHPRRSRTPRRARRAASI